MSAGLSAIRRPSSCGLSFAGEPLEELGGLRLRETPTDCLDSPQEGELPFPVAITRRKLSLTTEPLHKFLLLIDHFDSLMRTSVIFVGAATLNDGLAKFLEDKELSERPPLGNWVKAFQALSEQSAAYGLTSLPNDLSSRMKPP